MHDVVNAVHDMMGQLVGDAIDIVLHLDARRSCVHAGAHRMEQVILNLVINARDAMPDGGRLTLTTSNPPGPPTAPTRCASR